jgi:hypothetical protein
MEKNKIGSIILFGDYNWSILDIKNDMILIITENIIEQRPYHDVYKDITWADCSLRKYLNGKFYDKFNADDRSKIIPVINKNPDNQWYGTKGGADTKDSIFLLNIEEVVCRYFGDSSAILQNSGNQKYKYWFNKKDENNSKRMAKNFMSWWLRSSARVNRVAAYIHGIAQNQLESSVGCVGVNGNNITSLGGVRPALWLKIK